MEILLFEVAGERCALAVADVLRVVPAAAVAPLPGAPAVVDGVLDLHGRVVPVLSLAAPLRASGPPAPPRRRVRGGLGRRTHVSRSAPTPRSASPAWTRRTWCPAGDVVARPGARGRRPPAAGRAGAESHDLRTFLSDAEAAGVDAALAAAEGGA
jgi:purine-binding chemotaxis protein CheW